MTKNTMNRILNNVAKGLNERLRLPKYIFVIMDVDILNCINFYDYTMGKTFHRCVQWIVKNVNHLLAIRRDDLKAKKPGVFHDDPRLIWINVINRPIIRDHP